MRHPPALVALRAVTDAEYALARERSWLFRVVNRSLGYGVGSTQLSTSLEDPR